MVKVEDLSQTNEHLEAHVIIIQWSYDGTEVDTIIRNLKEKLDIPLSYLPYYDGPHNTSGNNVKVVVFVSSEQDARKVKESIEASAKINVLEIMSKYNYDMVPCIAEVLENMRRRLISLPKLWLTFHFKDKCSSEHFGIIVDHIHAYLLTKGHYTWIRGTNKSEISTLIMIIEAQYTDGIIHFLTKEPLEISGVGSVSLTMHRVPNIDEYQR